MFFRKKKTLYANSHAVVIGIDAYGQMPRLSAAVKDAKSIAKLLPEVGFEKERIVTLYNSQATGNAIRHVLDDILRETTRKNDRVLVFFSGHGLDRPLPNDRKEGYICPVDGDPEKIGATCIRMTEIRDWSDAIAAKHILFLMDCCYSGLAVDTARRVAVNIPDYLYEVAKKPCRHIITAGRAGEVARELDGHGIFTRELISGLKGAADVAKRGFVTGEMLGTFLKERVANASRGKQNPVSRQFDGEGEFIFIMPQHDDASIAEPEPHVAYEESDISYAKPEVTEDDSEYEDNEVIADCVRDAMRIGSCDVRAGECPDWEAFSESRSAHWLEGTEFDCAEAQYLLGLWMLTQGETSDDGWKINTGVEWICKSAQQGFAPAQTLFGICSLEGTGVDRDEKEAVVWLKLAAKQSDALGQYHLANCFFDGDGVRKNVKTAAQWYALSAENGYGMAQQCLGAAYLEGDGLPQDIDLGIQWIRLAAKAGTPISQRFLGELYATGEVVRRNRKTAFSWYLKAAQQGDMEAQYLVGQCLLSGEGTDEDSSQAIEWLQAAVDQGHGEALELLDRIA